MVFHKDTTVQAVKDYPFDATFGKVLKKAPEDYTDVKALVVADYQDQLEKDWVATLRKNILYLWTRRSWIQSINIKKENSWILKIK